MSIFESYLVLFYLFVGSIVAINIIVAVHNWLDRKFHKETNTWFDGLKWAEELCQKGDRCLVQKAVYTARNTGYWTVFLCGAENYLKYSQSVLIGPPSGSYK